jgi:hypothetical protein
MAAHRYWRLTITDVPGTFKCVVVAGLEFKETMGGATVAPTVFTASSVWDVGATYQASNLLDGNPATYYQSDDVLPVSLTADFGATPRDIQQFTLRPYQGADGPTFAIKDATLEWSDDNVNWTVDQTISGMRASDYHPTNKRPFTRLSATPTNGKLSNRWRFVPTASQVPGSGGTGGVTITEFKLFDGATLLDRTTTGTRASSFYTLGEPYRAINGDLSNGWGCTEINLPAWLEVEYEQAFTPTSFSMRSTSEPGLSPKRWKLQYWDGAAFVDCLTTYSAANEPTWGASETRTYALFLDPRRRPLIMQS